MFADDSLLFLKAEGNNVRKALELVQLFATASGSQCNIEKSRLISLTEEDGFGSSGWTGDIINRGNIIRHLGMPIGEGTTNKQSFDWVLERIQKKMKRWEFILTPFHCRARLINTFLIPLITFASPLLQLSQKNWNSFQKPIKEFLWRNKLTGGKPWQWGKSAVAKPKAQGGLGILDPVDHSMALCA